jgi:hypothetical protein
LTTPALATLPQEKRTKSLTNQKWSQQNDQKLA